MRLRAIIPLILASSLPASAQSTLTVSPASPVAGHTLAIRYSPAPSFRPAPGESVVVEILAEGRSSRVHDLTLRRTGTRFDATWSVPPEAALLLLRVAVGERVDDRNGNGWSALVHRSSGTPVPEASTAWNLARRLGGLHGFRLPVDTNVQDVRPDPMTAIPDDDRARAWTMAMDIRDVQDRWVALTEFLRAYPELPDEPSAEVLVRSALAAKDWDAADELIHRMPRKEPMWLIALAEGLLAARTTIDRASVVAKESVNAARNWDPALKPPLLSMREYRRQRAFELPLALRTYGRTLVHLGYPAVAEKVYAEAFELLEARDHDVNAAYATVLKELGRTEKLRQVEKRIARTTSE